MRSHTAGAIVTRELRMLIAFACGMLLAAGAIFSMAGVVPTGPAPAAAVRQPQPAAVQRKTLHAIGDQPSPTASGRAIH